MAFSRQLLSTASILKPNINFQFLSQIPALFHTSSVLDLKYPNWKMVREVKVRKTVQKYGFERDSLNALRKNDLIPHEIKELAHEEIKKQPLDASYVRIHNRCMVTSRPRGLVKRWRLSRIVWRLEADYNKLSGVQRAMW